MFAKQNRCNCVTVCLNTMSNNSLPLCKLLPRIFYLCFLLSLLLLGNKVYFYGWTSATPKHSPLTRKSAKPVVTTLSDDMMFVSHTLTISLLGFQVGNKNQRKKKKNISWLTRNGHVPREKYWQQTSRTMAEIMQSKKWRMENSGCLTRKRKKNSKSRACRQFLFYVLAAKLINPLHANKPLWLTPY